MPTCFALPASWQMWSMCSQIFSIFRLKSCGLRAMVTPAVDHHDGVEGHADHGAALDKRLDLIVGELPVPVGKSRGSCDGSPKPGRCSESSASQKHSSHRCVTSRMMPRRSISFSSSRPLRCQRPLVIGSVSIDSRTVVDRSECDQTVCA